MPDEASDLGEFKQNLARPRRDAAVGRREKNIRMHNFDPWPCLKMLGKKRGLNPFWFRGVESH